MKKCWAYRRIAGSETSWVPCGRRAEPGEKLCEKHRAAIVGVGLGLLVHAEGNDGDENGNVTRRRQVTEAAKNSKGIRSLR